MIRLSVTDLESYRYWKANEDSTLDQLLVRLRHQEPTTPQMAAGHAFAKVFEEAPQSGVLLVEQREGWTFDFTPLDDEMELPPVRELKGEMQLDTPSGLVTVVGKVDSLQGTKVRDQKLTERWEAEKYVDSLQWRTYLAMFQAQSFTYDVFQGRYEGRYITITDYHPMTFYAYPELRADVERAVAELASVVATHL